MYRYISKKFSCSGRVLSFLYPKPLLPEPPLCVDELWGRDDLFGKSNEFINYSRGGV